MGDPSQPSTSMADANIQEIESIIYIIDSIIYKIYIESVAGSADKKVGDSVVQDDFPLQNLSFISISLQFT